MYGLIGVVREFVFPKVQRPIELDVPYSEHRKRAFFPAAVCSLSPK
jgi:hypothetical protein